MGHLGVCKEFHADDKNLLLQEASSIHFYSFATVETYHFFVSLKPGYFTELVFYLFCYKVHNKRNTNLNILVNSVLPGSWCKPRMLTMFSVLLIIVQEWWKWFLTSWNQKNEKQAKATLKRREEKGKKMGERGKWGEKSWKGWRK